MPLETPEKWAEYRNSGNAGEITPAATELKVLRLKAEVYDLSRSLQPLNERISAINADIQRLVGEINSLQPTQQASDDVD